MKSLVLLSAFLMFGCATRSTRILASDINEVTPKLFLQPAYIFDMECSQKTGFKIEQESQVEFFEKMGLFQNEWDKYAKALIMESEKAAGKKFERKEFSVALTLCAWTPMGDPALIVSVRPYLGKSRTDKNTQLPLNMNAFVAMLHHELLHSLVANVVSEKFFKTSDLLEKYKNEPSNVLVHLHLLAIQMTVNDKLGVRANTDATEGLYSYIGGDYQRAWNIVKTEGSEKFLLELQAFNSNP